MHIHKYQIVAENYKWKIKKCSICEKTKEIEKLKNGYQPKPLVKN